MTEHKNSSAMAEEIPPAVKSLIPQLKKSRNARNGSVVLSTLALAFGVGLYFYGKHQVTTASQALAAQLSDFRQQVISDRQYLMKQLQAQTSALNSTRQQQNSISQQIYNIKKIVETISSGDVNTWLLIQADFLVKMASRKLCDDKDVITAIALLKNADASLAHMNDPSIIGTRRALRQDISMLTDLNQVDYDGIMLKLNQLSNDGIDNLHIADEDNEIMNADGSVLSSSLHEWPQNLAKSWHNFMDDFITIRRRNTTVEPLREPNQQVYLRENIRSQLLIASQAVLRHQNEIYKKSLENVSAWIQAWYKLNDVNNKAFLRQLDELSHQNISIDIPEALRSPSLLDKLMQARQRHLLTQSPTSAGTLPQHRES